MTHEAEENKERVLSSEVLYRGKWMSIRSVVVETPSGRRGYRTIVEHSGSVAVVPVLDEGRLLMIKQFRLAAGETIWEIPAGHIEEGEDAEACAKRELEEETGFRAGSVERLFEAYLSPGSSTELMRFYLATGLERTKQMTEDDEIIRVEAVEVDRVMRMIASNEIRDAKSIAAVAYLHSLGRLSDRGTV